MPEFTIIRQINAPVERVWDILDDFGDIHRWNPGVKASELTSEGQVTEGSTRHCDFAPFGAVNERIERHEPNQRLTVSLYQTFKLPISSAMADFQISAQDGGTELTLHYDYTLNFLGRMAKGLTGKQMRKGMDGLADALKEESERVAVA